MYKYLQIRLFKDQLGNNSRCIFETGKHPLFPEENFYLNSCKMAWTIFLLKIHKQMQFEKQCIPTWDAAI